MGAKSSPDRLMRLFFLLILFAVSYGIAWIVGSVIFSAWVSPMHWLIPIPGFFLAFFAFEWIEQFLELRLANWWFPIFLVLLLLVTFFVAVWFYYCNAFTDIQGTNSTCDSAGSQRAMQYIGSNGTNLLTQDAFFYFGIAVVLAWVSRVLWQKALEPVGTFAKPKKKK